MSEHEQPEADDQTTGEAASQPGRRRDGEGGERARASEHDLYEDVPGQAGEPAGDGA
jgi:hypothetical protein